MATEFKALEVKEYELVAAWLSDPEINKWLVDWRGKQVGARLIGIVSMNTKNKLFVLTEDGEACGLIALGNFDPASRSAELWYLLGDNRWHGKGIISRGVGKFIGFCFSDLGLESLNAQAMMSNTASIRIQIKLGFRKTGVLNDGEILPGEDSPRVGFKLVKTREN